MDLVTFLAIAVAVLVALSAYLLFNDVPTFGAGSGRQRPRHR